MDSLTYRLLVLLGLLVATFARAEKHAPFGYRFRIDDAFGTVVGGAQFTASIECETRCVGAERETKQSIVRTFSAEKRGLRRGNGNYWGSLGWNIQAWSREQCLEHAMETCRKDGTAEQKLAAIAKFSANEIKSGKWTVAEPIDCSARNTSMPSPFGAGAGATFDQKVAATEAGDAARAPVDPPPKKPAKCDTPISAEMCMGDCLAKESALGTDDIETLASYDPHKAGKREVCGDKLYDALKGKKYSAAVIQHFCDRYLWKAVLDTGERVGPASCAATRITPNCDKLVERLSE